MPSSSWLLELPIELLVEQILRRLDFRDVLRCSSCCKLLHGIVTTSAALWLKVELGADGITDVSLDGATSSAERLEALLQRRSAWRRLTWRAVQRTVLPSSYNPDQVLHIGDACVYAEDVHDLDQSPHTWTHISVSWLPRWNSPERWIDFQDTSLWVYTFMFDPVQDLLVLLEQQREIVGYDAHDPAPYLTTDKELAIHLHSLTSNTGHPDASSPIIRYRVILTTERGWSTRANIIICDDIVGLLFGTDTPRLIVWKWKSGDMIVNCDLLENAPHAYCFLSPRVFVATDPPLTQDACEVYMDVYVLRDTAVGDTPGNCHDTEAGGLTLAVRLELPVLNDHFLYYDKVHYHSTFIPHMRPGLLIATFDYGMDDALGSYRLVACARDIIHFAESSTGPGMEIPWESWGPASTRIFLDVLESDQAFLCPPTCTAGNRTAFPLASVGHGDTDLPRIEVCEFGYHLLRTAMPPEFNTLIPARGAQPSMFVELKTASHIFEAGEDSPFWNDIETRLPYYSITFLDLPAEDSDHAITLDDQRLVFHKDSQSEDSESSTERLIYFF